MDHSGQAQQGQNKSWVTPEKTWKTDYPCQIAGRTVLEKDMTWSEVVTSQDSNGAGSQNRISRSRNWFRNHPWTTTFITLVFTLAFVRWYSAGEPAEDTKLIRATVERGNIEELVPAAGRVEPVSYVDVGAQVSGQLQALHVVVGQTVEKGQLLAEIDASVQANRVEASRASIRAEEAQLSAREAALTLARSDIARKEKLKDQGASSQADYDVAVNTLAAATSSLVELQSQIVRSKASLASDEAQLGYSKIYAPESGTVVSITMTEGQTLNATQQVPTILRIADLSRMTVRAEVSEADVGRLQPGTPVYFTTLGGRGRRWPGKVEQILPTPSVENNVVLYPVLFTVDNDNRALLPDMTAQVFFITASANGVLKVPMAALQNRVQDSAVVQLIVADRKTEPRRVQLGLTTRVVAEIRSGLEEGDQIVVGGPDD